MTQALATLQWAVAAALFVLGVLTAVDWLRHGGRSRLYLSLAVGLLGLLALIGRITQFSGTAALVLAVLSIVLLMASAFAFVLFRDSLIPMRPRRLRLVGAAVTVTTGACIAANLDVTTQPTGVALITVIALLLTWCGVVGASIIRLWSVSRTVPRVQRARLRSLSAGFSGIVLALLGSAVATVVSDSTGVQVVVASVVLLSMPLLGVALSPPRWLRRVWREAEEVQLRHALNNLLLFSPNEETLAARALEWAARLLGGGAALIALNGRVLALTGIAPRRRRRSAPRARGDAPQRRARVHQLARSDRGGAAALPVGRRVSGGARRPLDAALR